MHYTIYKITCKITGKIYIGKHQTKDLNDDYMGSGKLLLRAQHKYGLENFTKQILHIFKTEEEMNKCEAELVTEDFCTRKDTFNICPGGQGGWGYVNKNNLNNLNKDKSVIYEKVSNALRGRVRPAVTASLKVQYENGRKITTTPQYGNKYACKRIQCIETGIIYESISDAALDKGIAPGTIRKHKNKGKYIVL